MGCKCKECGGEIVLTIEPVYIPDGFSNSKLCLVCKKCGLRTSDFKKYSDTHGEK